MQYQLIEMDYHFNLYDDLHYGLQLNHIDIEIYNKYIEGDDEYSDLNVITLKLDPEKHYFLDIDDDYCCWGNSEAYTLHQVQNYPIGNLFYIKYNNELNRWESENIN